jgi:hypothetical protein
MFKVPQVLPCFPLNDVPGGNRGAVRWDGGLSTQSRPRTSPSKTDWAALRVMMKVTPAQSLLMEVLLISCWEEQEAWMLSCLKHDKDLSSDFALFQI